MTAKSTGAFDHLPASKPCGDCGGTGAVDDILRPGTPRKCYTCDGRGAFPRPAFNDILDRLRLTRGKGKGRLRKSFCSYPDRGEPDPLAHRRAHYVWRMARFHGGADVTMPCSILTRDPYQDDFLEPMASALARKVFGSDMAAAYRWGNLLGFSGPAPKGLPASAYEGGPAHDGQDDDTNAMEAIDNARRDAEAEGADGTKAEFDAIARLSRRLE